MSRETAVYNPVQITKEELQKRVLKQFGLNIEEIPKHQWYDLMHRLNLGFGRAGLQYELRMSVADPLPPFTPTSGQKKRSMKQFIPRVNQLLTQKLICFVPLYKKPEKVVYYRSTIMWTKGVLSTHHCLCCSPMCPVCVPRKSHIESKEDDGKEESEESVVLKEVGAEYELCHLCATVCSNNSGARRPHFLLCLQNKSLAPTWSPPMRQALLVFFHHHFDSKSPSARQVTTVGGMQTWFASNQGLLQQRARVPVPKKKRPKKRGQKKGRKKVSEITIKLSKKSCKNGKHEM